MFEQVPDINVVAIITPSGMHHGHALDVLRRYRKHLIVEKPTFLHPQHLDEVYDLAARSGVQIFPVFQNRFNKAVGRLHRAINDGEIGDIRILSICVRWCRPERYYQQSPWRGTFSHDGGALTNQSIHHVDLLRYLGGEIERVGAEMRTLGVENVEVEDTVVGTVVFASGAVGSIEVTTAARPIDYEASLSVVGSRGLAQIGGLAVNELQIFSPDPDACNGFSETIPDAYGFGHISLYRHVVATLKDGAPFPVDRDDCAGTLSLLHALYRSDEIGMHVHVKDKPCSERLGRANPDISALYTTPPP